MAKQTFYLDSCVFLALFRPDDQGRHRPIRQLIELGKTPKVSLVTSILTIGEVAYGAQEKHTAVLDQAVLDDIDAYWHPLSPIQLMEVDQLLSYDARALSRKALEQQLGCPQGIDAIHLATAQRVGVDAFYTYDQGLMNKAELLGFPITEPVEQAEEDDGENLFTPAG